MRGTSVNMAASVDMISSSTSSNPSSDTNGHGHSHENGLCGSSGSEGKLEPSIFDAVKSGMLIPVQTIVENEGIQILRSKDDKGHTPAHWACLGGHITILRFIIENKGPVDEASENDLGQRPVHWACVNGHIAVVDVLLQTGVNIDVVDNKGCTPLIVACQYGKTMLAGYLLGKGARAQIVDKDGDTALHWAAFKGFNELMRLLVYSGFNPHQKDNYGQTPLHLACISGNLTSVQELCEQDNVEIDLADKNGKTPLMLALGRKHEKVVQYLKKETKSRSKLIPKIDIWSVVFGPPGNTKGPLIFLVLSVLCWGYPMYLVKCLPVTWFELKAIHIIFMGLNVVMWVSLYHASTIDPGFLPRNIPEYDRAIKEVAHYDEWKHGRNPLSRLCHTCRTVKPMRSKHCKICNRCVKMFDHHCPYIYNCVGINNRVSFMSFTCAMMAISVMTLYFGLYIWSMEEWEFRFHYALGLLHCSFFGMIAWFVGVTTIYHMALNLTTNERINHRRYDYLKDGKGKYHNAYDRGWKNNILEFFHLKRGLADDEVEFLNITVV